MGGWVVRPEGTLASIAVVTFFKECEVRSEDEHLGGSESREERPGRLRLVRI